MTFGISEYWLLAGVTLLVLEAVGLPGVGLLFAGLGALTVGGLIDIGVVDAGQGLTQALAFLLATSAWTAMLWRPMRRFYSNQNKTGYNNMVGETAYAGNGGLSKGAVGEATWSGTIMRATLAADAGVDSVESGAPLVIVEVKGATLIVRPR